MDLARQPDRRRSVGTAAADSSELHCRIEEKKKAKGGEEQFQNCFREKKRIRDEDDRRIEQRRSKVRKKKKERLSRDRE